MFVSLGADIPLQVSYPLSLLVLFASTRFSSAVAFIRAPWSLACLYFGALFCTTHSSCVRGAPKFSDVPWLFDFSPPTPAVPWLEYSGAHVSHCYNLALLHRVAFCVLTASCLYSYSAPTQWVLWWLAAILSVCKLALIFHL